jgi:hypothetical protein
VGVRAERRVPYRPPFAFNARADPGSLGFEFYQEDGSVGGLRSCDRGSGDGLLPIQRSAVDRASWRAADSPTRHYAGASRISGRPPTPRELVIGAPVELAPTGLRGEATDLLEEEGDPRACALVAQLADSCHLDPTPPGSACPPRSPNECPRRIARGAIR